MHSIAVISGDSIAANSEDVIALRLGYCVESTLLSYSLLQGCSRVLMMVLKTLHRAGMESVDVVERNSWGKTDSLRPLGESGLQAGNTVSLWAD